MLGEWDVDRMLAEIPSELFSEWIAYYKLEPFGDEWLMTSYLCATMCNLASGKSTDMIELDYFVPKFKSAKQRKRFDAKAHEAKMAAMFNNKGQS